MPADAIIALEIGGTKLQAAAGTPEGEILYTLRHRVELDKGVPGILAWCSAAMNQLEEYAQSRCLQVRAAGVGFGGPIDTAAGSVLTSHQVSGWNGITLRDSLGSGRAYGVTVANDSNAAGWGEYVLGTGRGTRHFVYMNIGSGIGGALVFDGRLYDGQGVGAGEIGHTWVADWTAATPGAIDKLENLCSGWAIERRIRAWNNIPEGSPLHDLCGGDASSLTCAQLGQAAAAGDALAGSELDLVARAVATALANVLALVQPQRIALGGGVSLIGDPLLSRIRRELDTLAFGPCHGRYDIQPCALGEAVVLHGALLLAAAE
jgi:glucokinase